jgi:hypothetical protein
MGDLMRLLHRFAELSSAESIKTAAVTQTKVSPCNFAFGLTCMGGIRVDIVSKRSSWSVCDVQGTRSFHIFAPMANAKSFAVAAFPFLVSRAHYNSDGGNGKVTTLKLFSISARDSETFYESQTWL